jgi:hypothetical protein
MIIFYFQRALPNSLGITDARAGWGSVWEQEKT